MVELVPKIKIEVVVPDQTVTRVVETIAKAAKTGKIGDGKIFVSPVEEAVRIQEPAKEEKGRFNKEGQGKSLKDEG